MVGITVIGTIKTEKSLGNRLLQRIFRILTILNSSKATKWRFWLLEILRLILNKIDNKLTLKKQPKTK